MARSLLIRYLAQYCLGSLQLAGGRCVSLLLAFQAAGTSFTSGPHAALAVGVSERQITTNKGMAAIAVGVSARQLSTLLNTYAAIAVGVSARQISTLLAVQAAIATGLAAFSEVATFLASATATAIGAVVAQATFIPGAGAGGGVVRALWSLINRVLRYWQITTTVNTPLEDLNTETTDANSQRTETRPKSPQL